MKKKLNYKQALKEYGAEKTLELYLHSKIELTTKEWKDLHKKIGRNGFAVNGGRVPTMIVCFGILILAVLMFQKYEDFNFSQCVKDYNLNYCMAVK